MPIVTIEVLEDDPPIATGQQQLQVLADQLGELFGSTDAGTWVKLRRLARADYAENRVHIEEDVRPTFVEVLHRSLPGPDALADQAQQVSQVVARCLDRPAGSVHVLYLPEGRGRIAFGGQLVI